MKISQLLESTEAQLFDTIIQGTYFKKNVAPLINAEESAKNNVETLHRSGVLLYHGTRGEMNKIYSQKLRTGTRDTVTYVHDTINNYAMDKLGVPVRNLMFVTNNSREANAYGRVGVVMPLSNFTIYMNPNVTDFTVTYRSAHTMSELDFHLTLVAHITGNIYDDYFHSDLYDKEDKNKGLLEDQIKNIVIDVIEQSEEITIEKVRSALMAYKKASETSDEKFAAICKFVYEKFKQYHSEYTESLKEYVDGIESYDDIVDPSWRWCEMMLKADRFAILSSHGFEESQGLYQLIKYYLEHKQ